MLRSNKSSPTVLVQTSPPPTPHHHQTSIVVGSTASNGGVGSAPSNNNETLHHLVMNNDDSFLQLSPSSTNNSFIQPPPSQMVFNQPPPSSSLPNNPLIFYDNMGQPQVFNGSNNVLNLLNILANSSQPNLSANNHHHYSLANSSSPNIITYNQQDQSTTTPNNFSLLDNLAQMNPMLMMHSTAGVNPSSVPSSSFNNSESQLDQYLSNIMTNQQHVNNLYQNIQPQGMWSNSEMDNNMDSFLDAQSTANTIFRDDLSTSSSFFNDQQGLRSPTSNSSTARPEGVLLIDQMFDTNTLNEFGIEPLMGNSSPNNQFIYSTSPHGNQGNSLFVSTQPPNNMSANDVTARVEQSLKRKLGVFLNDDQVQKTKTLTKSRSISNVSPTLQNTLNVPQLPSPNQGILNNLSVSQKKAFFKKAMSSLLDEDDDLLDFTQTDNTSGNSSGAATSNNGIDKFLLDDDNLTPTLFLGEGSNNNNQYITMDSTDEQANSPTGHYDVVNMFNSEESDAFEGFGPSFDSDVYNLTEESTEIGSIPMNIKRSRTSSPIEHRRLLNTTISSSPTVSQGSPTISHILAQQQQAISNLSLSPNTSSFWNLLQGSLQQQQATEQKRKSPISDLSNEKPKQSPRSRNHRKFPPNYFLNMVARAPPNSPVGSRSSSRSSSKSSSRANSLSNSAANSRSNSPTSSNTFHYLKTSPIINSPTSDNQQVITSPSNSYGDQFAGSEFLSQLQQSLNASINVQGGSPNPFSINPQNRVTPLTVPRAEHHFVSIGNGTLPQNILNSGAFVNLGSNKIVSPPGVMQTTIHSTLQQPTQQKVASDDSSNVMNQNEDDFDKQRKHFLPSNATDVLRDWFLDHITHPYPSGQEKQALAQQTGLSYVQVSNWFTNTRKRSWQLMRKEHEKRGKPNDGNPPDTNN